MAGFREPVGGGYVPSKNGEKCVKCEEKCEEKCGEKCGKNVKVNGGEQCKEWRRDFDHVGNRAVGLFDGSQKDACGVGFIADIFGRPSRRIISDGWKLLVRMNHRGGGNEEEGDGAGMMVGMPHTFLEMLASSGRLTFQIPPIGRYGVAMVFLPISQDRRFVVMEEMESVVRKGGLCVLGWRCPLPVKSNVLSGCGRAAEPFIAQMFVCSLSEYLTYSVPIGTPSQSPTRTPPSCVEHKHVEQDNTHIPAYCRDAILNNGGNGGDIYIPSKDLKQKYVAEVKKFEKKLYCIRRIIANIQDTYICSFSATTIVYKGLFNVQQLFNYYDDLSDEDFQSHFCMVHSRFSTNTFPSWARAHPFRRICHNGEINTIEGNRRWLSERASVFPIEEPPPITTYNAGGEFGGSSETKQVKEGSSDSAVLDNVLEYLAMGGDVDEDCEFYEGSTSESETVVATVEQTSAECDEKQAKIDEKNCERDEKKCEQDEQQAKNNESKFEKSAEPYKRDMAHALLMLMPEPIRAELSTDRDKAKKQAFYRYHSCLMEPWDGPALVAFTDGLSLGASLDRGGLRPGRYYITSEGTVILSSEVGVVDVPNHMVKCKGRLRAGRIFLIDFMEGRVISDEELKTAYSEAFDYEEWLSVSSTRLEEVALPLTNEEELRGELGLTTERGCPRVGRHRCDSTLHGSPLLDDSRRAGIRRANSSMSAETKKVQYNLKRRLKAFGLTQEKLEVLLDPMAKRASDGLGSMGNDGPLAILSQEPSHISYYFQQTFSQATNPAIDPIREAAVMSLETPLGNRPHLLDHPSHIHCKRIFLQEPILDTSHFRALKSLPNAAIKCLDITYDIKEGPGYASVFLNGLASSTAKWLSSAREGFRLLVLSDRTAGPCRMSLFSPIVVGFLHQGFINLKQRSMFSIVLEVGDTFDVHQFAFLHAAGADAIYPYAAYQSLSLLTPEENETSMSLGQMIENYRSAVHFGLLKVMSKAGVCTLMSYKGAMMMQAVGISTSLLRLCFSSEADSVIGGVDLHFFANESFRLHGLSYGECVREGLGDEGEFYFRSLTRTRIRHMNHPETITSLQRAVRLNSKSVYERFAEFQNRLVDECEIRGQLDFAYDVYPPISLSEVEPASSIVRRFATGAMSYGAISKEAHEALAVAMNRIGGRSNTGEGGESSSRYNTRNTKGEVQENEKRSAIKQIASGRFGVDIEYLTNADELQIKLSQGAKPGEGGELPGYKVTNEIASTRKSTPGVGLISPPPHHDMYSIEDVAQTISDLKNANPAARVSVKLVSKLGVGIIASGIAKGKADQILISGASGGTGAAKWTSIKHAGLPWEIGLSQTHQCLVLNKLRHKVVLQVDGQLKTGRDVLFGFLFGAEEVCFATQPLIALGCVMMRKCHLNTCPVGIATQDPELVAKFRGQPQHVINYMFMVAEEVRELMAKMGIRSVNQLIGRTDLIHSKTQKDTKKKSLNFDKLLTPAWTFTSNSPTAIYAQHRQDHNLEQVLDRELIRLCRGALEGRHSVSISVPIRNVDRTVGAMLSGEICRRFDRDSLPGHLSIAIRFRGHAGQSFGAFLCSGVRFQLVGDSNDYFGKGLSGGSLSVTPPSDSSFHNNAHEHIIIGNAALYGATKGKAYIAGQAAERFAVRNSGAIAVVEGCGDHGCEYMTRGMVVVLGEVGGNFAAGMSGGIAYCLDLDHCRVNSQMVELLQVFGQKDIQTLESLIQDHYQATKSARASLILSDFRSYIPRFTKVFPREMKRVLRAAIRDFIHSGSRSAAAILDDWKLLTDQGGGGGDGMLYRFLQFYLLKRTPNV